MGLVQDIINVDEKYEQAIVTALSGRLQDILVKMLIVQNEQFHI